MSDGGHRDAIIERLGSKPYVDPSDAAYRQGWADARQHLFRMLATEAERHPADRGGVARAALMVRDATPEKPTVRARS